MGLPALQWQRPSEEQSMYNPPEYGAKHFKSVETD